jgi:hypothetical protein
LSIVVVKSAGSSVTTSSPFGRDPLDEDELEFAAAALDGTAESPPPHAVMDIAAATEAATK